MHDEGGIWYEGGRRVSAAAAPDCQPRQHLGSDNNSTQHNLPQVFVCDAVFIFNNTLEQKIVPACFLKKLQYEGSRLLCDFHRCAQRIS